MKPMLPEFGQCGELFHTPSGTAFADIPLKDHRETSGVPGGSDVGRALRPMAH
jgi:hypothetical protein